jgi:hypothetical protein
LSLAELITGLSRAPKLRTKVRIGWLAPMFGIFVIMDFDIFLAQRLGNPHYHAGEL